MNLRSAAFQCPLQVMTNKKPHKSFFFFVKSLKNSKQLRLTLHPSPKTVSNTTIYYASKLNILVPSLKVSELDRIGRKIFLPEKFKNFIFKLARNRLKLGAQLSHFTHIDGDCTPCKKLYSTTIPETCHHVFFSCNFYKNLHSQTLAHYFDE